MEMILVAAVGRQGELGREGQLSFQVPEDLQHFKQLTMGHSILMGRKTFLSLGRVLPRRTHWVLTRHQLPNQERVFYINSLAQFFSNCKDDLVFVIGGSEIYQLVLNENLVSQMVITKIDGEDPLADTFFPNVNWDDWELTKTVALNQKAQIEYFNLKARRVPR